MKLTCLRKLLFVCLVVSSLSFQQQLVLGDDLEDESYFGMSMNFVAARGVIWVAAVTPGAPAELAGLRSNDLIVAVNGESLGFDNDLDMLHFFEEFKPGDRVLFTVQRNGASQQIEVEPKAMPVEAYQRLEKWKENAAARLEVGPEACDDAGQVAAPRGKASPRWNQFLRSVTSERKFVVVKDPSSLEILLKEDVASEGVLPNLRFEDLGMAWAEAYANDLKPGDSFTLKVTFHPEDRSSSIEAENLPSYVTDNMQSYVKALAE